MSENRQILTDVAVYVPTISVSRSALWD